MQADQIVKKDAETNPEPLKAIKVGINNDEGSVTAVKRLERPDESGLRRCHLNLVAWCMSLQ